MNKPVNVSRRRALKGLGVSLALPWLESLRLPSAVAPAEDSRGAVIGVGEISHHHRGGAARHGVAQPGHQLRRLLLGGAQPGGNFKVRPHARQGARSRRRSRCSIASCGILRRGA